MNSHFLFAHIFCRSTKTFRSNHRTRLLLLARDILLSLKRHRPSSLEVERSPVEPLDVTSSLSLSTLLLTPRLLLLSTTRKPPRPARPPKPRKQSSMMVLPSSNASRRVPSLLSWLDLPDRESKPKLPVTILTYHRNTHSDLTEIDSSFFSSLPSPFSPLSDAFRELSHWIKFMGHSISNEVIHNRILSNVRCDLIWCWN